MNRGGTERTTAHSAVVRAADGVRFVAVGRGPDEVARLLVDYIRGRCDHVLWPCDASRVRTLIDAGESYAAIDEYFEHVGSRWDEERLFCHPEERSDEGPLYRRGSSSVVIGVLRASRSG